MLSKDIKVKVVNYCNRDIVPDSTYMPEAQFHSQWFADYFSFLPSPQLQEHLGDAFYQARFIYKLMSALSLPLAKQKGIVKFQIIQYASICEAVLDYTIELYFKEESISYFSSEEYIKCQNALSYRTKISYDNEDLYLCRSVRRKGDLKRTRIDLKVKFAYEKGFILQDTKNKFLELYDQRNNVHILKAMNSNYIPKLYEAKNSFLIMQSVIEEIKQYYTVHPK